MTNNRIVTNLIIIAVASAGIALFTYIFVEHHLDTPSRAKRDAKVLLSAGKPGAELIKPVGEVVTTAPAVKEQEAAPAAEIEQVAEVAAPAEVNGEQVYQSACVACHAAGIAGAPKVGDAAEWAKRSAKGKEAIYSNALNGLGAMPAKGANPTLSDEQVKAAVDYMLQ